MSTKLITDRQLQGSLLPKPPISYDMHPNINIANCCDYPSFHFTSLYPDKFVAWHLATFREVSLTALASSLQQESGQSSGLFDCDSDVGLLDGWWPGNGRQPAKSAVNKTTLNTLLAPALAFKQNGQYMILDISVGCWNVFTSTCIRISVRKVCPLNFKLTFSLTTVKRR